MNDQRDPTTEPQVWIADLAAYNAGHLHGEWVAADDLDELEAAAKRIIASSPADFAEEIAIHDYEGFGDYDLGEYPGLPLVAALGSEIAERGDAFVAFIGIGRVTINSADDVAEAVTAFEESYRGETTIKEYADENAQTYIGGALTHEQWVSIESYVDTDGLAQELDNEGFYEQEVGGKTFLFGP